MLNGGMKEWIAMKILDVCCGSRMFWYDKEESHTTYMDIRKAGYTAKDRGHERRIEIKDVFKAFGQQPILGDMKSKTKWSVFIKNE